MAQFAPDQIHGILYALFDSQVFVMQGIENLICYGKRLVRRPCRRPDI
ncbi:hypothetical protein [Mesorhizobium sp. RIZ17]